jgi:hypothetical protein
MISQFILRRNASFTCFESGEWNGGIHRAWAKKQDANVGFDVSYKSVISMTKTCNFSLLEKIEWNKEKDPCRGSGITSIYHGRHRRQEQVTGLLNIWQKKERREGWNSMRRGNDDRKGKGNKIGGGNSSFETPCKALFIRLRLGLCDLLVGCRCL